MTEPLALTVGGVRLDAAWWGRRDGPALVLLHEGLGSVGLWRDFPARLAERTGLGVFAWSRRGYGRSAAVSLPRPLDYMDREAALVGAVLRAAGIGRCVLVGHSDGATIAALAAAGPPGEAPGELQAEVAGLVLIAPHYFVEAMTLVEIARARDLYRDGDLRSRLARHHDDVDGAFLGWNGAWLDPGFPQALDARPALARIRVPMLQLQGGADPYGTAAQTDCAARVAGGSVRTVILPDARHAPQFEAAEATLSAIAAFLAGIDGFLQDNSLRSAGVEL